MKSILDSLLKYTLSHFKYEEQVLKEHKYPDLMSHAALHGKIRQKTRELQEQADLVKGHGMLRLLWQSGGLVISAIARGIHAVLGVAGQSPLIPGAGDMAWTFLLQAATRTIDIAPQPSKIAHSSEQFAAKQ